MQMLLGVQEVLLVSQDGSPHGPKDFVLWNPPLTDEAAELQSNTEARVSGK